MRVGFSGTQRGMTPLQMLVLHDLLTYLDEEVDEFHHGDCIGADQEADRIAHEFADAIIIHPAIGLDHKRAYCMDRGGKRSELEPMRPLMRNRAMVGVIDLLIAGPSTSSMVLRSGTWATYRYAMQAGMHVVIIEPTGTEVWRNGSAIN